MELIDDLFLIMYSNPLQYILAVIVILSDSEMVDEISNSNYL